MPVPSTYRPIESLNGTTTAIEILQGVWPLPGRWFPKEFATHYERETQPVAGNKRLMVDRGGGYPLGVWLRQEPLFQRIPAPAVYDPYTTVNLVEEFYIHWARENNPETGERTLS